MADEGSHVEGLLERLRMTGLEPCYVQPVIPPTGRGGMTGLRPTVQLCTVALIGMLPLVHQCIADASTGGHHACGHANALQHDHLVMSYYVEQS